MFLENDEIRSYLTFYDVKEWEQKVLLDLVLSGTKVQ